MADVKDVEQVAQELRSLTILRQKTTSALTRSNRKKASWPNRWKA